MIFTNPVTCTGIDYALYIRFIFFLNCVQVQYFVLWGHLVWVRPALVAPLLTLWDVTFTEYHLVASVTNLTSEDIGMLAEGISYWVVNKDQS